MAISRAAIYLRGMDTAEITRLTLAMAASGEQIDLSPIEGVKVDKHSTGGVGDKTTLVVAPLVAACGVKIAKMSGRGLGHTGGTVDKMEAIPGLATTLSREAFLRQVNEIGIAVIGQSGNLAPADKKMYALRDVTATVSSLPLIASSIMSKKLAAGADAILLDVKVGGGAFMKTQQDAALLAKTMVDIGEMAGRRTAALLTNMNMPLGINVGNSMEVAEAVQTLRGDGPKDLTEVCLALAGGMLMLAGHGERAGCETIAAKALYGGQGLAKLREMVAAQGGDVATIDDPTLLPTAGIVHPVRAPRGGYITAMDTERVGIASVVLGAGRERKEDAIDPAAGLRVLAKPGRRVGKGQTVATLHTNCAGKVEEAEELYLSALKIDPDRPTEKPLVLGWVAADGAQK